MRRSFAVFRFLILSTFLMCVAAQGQGSKNMILAASRAGVVELIDPATLETVGRVHFDFPSRNAGLNGVSASADGSVLYVEGPISSDPKGCCELYSVDLATMRMEVTASIWGTHSRNAFVTSDGVTYKTAALTSEETIKDIAGDRLHLSPDGRWLFGVRNFRGAVLDVYDVAQRRVVRQLVPANQNGDGVTDGGWSGDHFYLYRSNHNGSGRLWIVSPETTQLDSGIAVEGFGQVAGCPEPVLMNIITLGTQVFLYEPFGWKLDRRERCPGVPGGAWLVNPTAGQKLRWIGRDLHFATLLPDPDGPILYGLAPGDASWSAPVQLVRINATDGRILRSRLLDRTVWRIVFAPLGVVPRGDVRVVSR